MRRSKRKASVVSARKTKEVLSATVKDASTTNADTESEDESNFADVEVEDLSDGEGALHGPCNVKPCNADENHRFVCKCLLMCAIYLPMMHA